MNGQYIGIEPQKAISVDLYQNGLEKTQWISLFHAIHQDRISDKVNTVVERVHPWFTGFWKKR